MAEGGWKPLGERLKDMPLVLAGPLLRHTSKSSVTVWIALKDYAGETVTLKVREYVSKNEVAAGSNKVIRLGEHLSVVAVTANPEEGDALLEPGRIYEYDLEFVPGPGGKKTLAGDGILSKQGGTGAIVYGDFDLPTFALPPENLEHLRLIHASCRNTRGAGPDAFPALSQMIRSRATDPLKRPHQLFLTGDQIYADDVADPLMMMIVDAASALLGGNEVLPKLDPELNQVTPDELCRLLAPGRRVKVVNMAGLSVTAAPAIAASPKPIKSGNQYAKSHLLRAAEYYAMYLFVWSDVLWPDRLPEFDKIDRDLLYSQLTGGLKGKAKLRRRRRYNNEKKLAEEIRISISEVRRALANIPSYMILDDHEVTDDFCRDVKWCSKAFSNDLGRRVIQNGLLSYAIFQAWGNTPDRFDKDGTAGSELLKTTEKWHRAHVDRDKAKAEAESQKIAARVGLPPIDDIFVNEQIRTPDAPARYNKVLNHHNDALDWNYVIQCDKYRVVVLEVRTRRAYLDNDILAQAVLLNRQTFESIINNIKDAKKENDHDRVITLVVSPIPAIFIPFVESFGVNLAASWERRLYYRDVDFWSVKLGFETLLAALASLGTVENGKRRSRIVLLSGDVHFSYTARLQYQAARPFNGLFSSPELETPLEAVFAQLTSSALRNQTSTTRAVHTHGYRAGGIFFLLGIILKPIITIKSRPLNYKPPKHVEVLGWTNKQEELPFKLGTVKIFTPGFGESEFPEAWSLSGNPATESLLARSPDPDDLATAMFLEKKRAVVSSAKLVREEGEDWSYRIDFIRGEGRVEGDGSSAVANKTNSARNMNVPPGGIDPRVETLKFHIDTAKLYRRKLRKGSGKEIVGLNNIAEVSFLGSDENNPVPTHVVQEIWWRMKSDLWVDEDEEVNIEDEDDEWPRTFPITKTVVSLSYDENEYPRLKIDGRK
jgi:hypothetical protein